MRRFHHATSEDFHAWAEDPARSVEERYSIASLAEYCYHSPYREPDRKWPGFEQELQVCEDCCYDPGYDPVPDPSLLRHKSADTDVSRFLCWKTATL